MCIFLFLILIVRSQQKISHKTVSPKKPSRLINFEQHRTLFNLIQPVACFKFCIKFLEKVCHCLKTLFVALLLIVVLIVFDCFLVSEELDCGLICCLHMFFI